MAIKKRQSTWFGPGLTLFFGLIIVLFAAANFYLILNGIYGKFSNDDLLPNFKSLKALFTSSKQKVAILNSGYTKNLLPPESTWLEDNLRSWEKFSSSFDYSYELISDQVIETKDLSKFDLVILPGSKSLSDKEIIQIKNYLEKGGNVLATGGIASFSNDGKWRGWDFFSEVFGIRFAKEIMNDEITKVHTLRGGHPITANIPAGYALKVATWDRPIAAEVLDPRAIQLSYWYDYKLDQGLVREEIKKSAGIVYGEYGKGRFIWMGFEINSIVGSTSNHVYLERLLKNSFNWLCRNPLAYVRDWPNDHSSAALILPYFENNFSNVSALLQIVKQKQINPTFVLGSDNKELMKLLSKYGEIIPAIAFGYPAAVSDSTNKLFDYQVQYESLKQVKARFENIIGKKIYGVMPLFGAFNKETLKVLAELDFNYIISDSSNGDALPKTLAWNDKRVIGLYNNCRDDYDVIKDLELTDSVFQFYTYQEDIDRILFENGLYIFKTHPLYQLQPKYIDVLSDLIDDLNKKNFWIANASVIGEWFDTKSQIEVGVKRMGNYRVRLTVSNASDKIAQEFDIDTDLSEKAYNISISAEIIGTTQPKYKKLNGGSLVRLTIQNLKPHESRIYYIDYENTTSIAKLHN